MGYKAKAPGVVYKSFTGSDCKTFTSSDIYKNKSYLKFKMFVAYINLIIVTFQPNPFPTNSSVVVCGMGGADSAPPEGARRLIF